MAKRAWRSTLQPEDVNGLVGKIKPKEDELGFDLVEDRFVDGSRLATAVARLEDRLHVEEED